MNQAKKRLILAITLAELGGATTFVLGFARWLTSRGFEVIVLAGEGQWLFDRCQEDGIRAIRVTSLRRAISPWNDVRAFFELRRLFRDLKPDAVHLNSTKMGVLGSLAAYFTPPLAPPRQGGEDRVSRIVYRIGGWVFLEPLPTLQKYFYLLIERLTARCKDTIVCVHPGDRIVAERERIRARNDVRVVPNGIDLPAFDARLLPRDEARRRLGTTNGFVFGTIAGFFPAKDLPRYLDACAIVSRAIPDARFVIIGDGPERKRIEETRDRLGLRTQVVLAADVLGNALDQANTFLRAFDAFVLPSAKEGMPWSLLEAMAASLPCIATDVGANAWMLGNEAGWIVPKQSPEALARTMIEAHANLTEAHKRAAAARREIEQRFPLEKTYQGNMEALA